MSKIRRPTKVIKRQPLGGVANTQKTKAPSEVAKPVESEKAATFTATKENAEVPSAAMQKSARIMNPLLLGAEFDALLEKPVPAKIDSEPSLSEFEALLEKPFTPSVGNIERKSSAPLLAELPPKRKTPAGDVSYAHDGESLIITGQSPEQKPDVVKKKMTLGRAAQYAAAFDAAIVSQYPARSTREPNEMWVSMAGATRGADMAMKLDKASSSAFDAAHLLKSLLPKSLGVHGSKTIMEQISAMSSLANRVMKEGKPMQNMVELEGQLAEKQGKSLLEELLNKADKSEAPSLLDEILSKPPAQQKLPDDDKAVVAQIDGRDVTAGDVREMALKEQKAVAFQIKGFADNHGSEHTLKMQVEKYKGGFKWSFYGVQGDRMRVIDGMVDAEGLDKLKKSINAQSRYDHLPYKPKLDRYSAKLTDAALLGIAKDRAKVVEQMKARGGGTPVSEIFPHLA